MVSIVIITHEEQGMLSQHLPAMLSQQGLEYEVLVVDMNSKDDTIEYLKSLEKSMPHLRHLSLPTSAKDISKERLALLLGVKSALSGQVLITNPEMEVRDEQWLAGITKRWEDGKTFLYIPTQRTTDRQLSARHDSWRQALYLRQAQKKGLFRAGSAVIGINREAYITHDAPAQLLALKTGVLDMYMSQVANRENTTILTEPELIPKLTAKHSHRYWRQKRLFDVETRRHLSHRLCRHTSYILYVLRTLHRASPVFCLMDCWDRLRWSLTNRQTFVKKHF